MQTQTILRFQALALISVAGIIIPCYGGGAG
jgi:hypothetical protein